MSGDRPKAQKLPSGSYRIQVRNPLAPDQKISIVRPSEGECIRDAEAYRRLRQDIRSGFVDRVEVAAKLRNAQRGGSPRVRDIWFGYVESFAPVRQRALKSHWPVHFAPHFEQLYAHELTADRWREWERWEGQRGRDVARSTIDTLFALMRAAFGRRVDDGDLPRLPWGKWKPSGQFGRPKAEREALRSPEEVAFVLSAARVHDEKMRAWGHYSDLLARVAALILAGLRQGEAAGLGWDDYQELDGKRVFVIRRQVRDGWATDNHGWERPLDPCKAGSTGTVVVHPTLVRILDDHQIYQRSRGVYAVSGPVFPARTGGWRRSRTTVEPDRFRDLLRAAGLEARGVDVERWVTHSARHTFATLEVLYTADIKATSERTRHKDQRVISMYMKRAGRGLPEPAIPELPIELPSAVQVLPAAVENDDGDPDDFADVLEEEAATEADEREAQDAERRTAQGAFRRAWDTWRAQGCPGPRPAEVTAEAERARSKAYMRVQRAGGSADAAKRAGRTARRAYLGAWGKARRVFEGGPVEVARPLVKRFVEAPAVLVGAPLRKVARS